MHRIRSRRRRFPFHIQSDVAGLAIKVAIAILLLLVAWSLVGTFLSLTVGQVLVVALAFAGGWWLRGMRR